ncbi:MAG: metallophosphoesterase [Clostridiales bacterium]|nr:metallophosphoesterase [Clostridiales bacterium]
MPYIIACTIAALLILIYIFCYYQNNTLDVSEYEIKTPKIKGEIKIAVVSDLHSKPFYKMLKKVRDIKPDIIAVTGDYINDKCKNEQKMLLLAQELANTAPVYYITGNHERRLGNFDDIMRRLEKAGFRVLLNKTALCRVKSQEIAFLGLDENQADFEDYKARKRGTFKYKDMSPYFAELAGHSCFKIVLSHYPENFCLVKENNYCQYDFDVQLSGHAHGGQFILPFIGPIFSPGQGFLPKYARGAFGNPPRLIVSRGLGNSEFPLRLFNHPELVVLKLTGEKEHPSSVQ